MKEKAGFIPYYNGKIMVCLSSNPKFGGNLFGLCKGGIEKNEPASYAALREAQEELGLKSENIVFDTFQKVGKFVSGNVSLVVFTAEIKDPANFGPTDDEISETKWMTPKEFFAKGRKQHTAIVQEWVKLVRKQK